MAQDREYELKFTIAPHQVGAILAHPLLERAMRERRVDHMVSTYFDTPDSLLQARRISLRVRRTAAGAVQTLKRAGGSLVDRDEWERAGDASVPSLAWLRATPLGPLFRRVAIADRLGPRFSVEVTRTRFSINHAGAVIEGALDQGTIRAGSASCPIDEFELELKQGRAGAVQALSRKLVADLPLVLSLSSKAERGYGTADKSWGHPTKALALDLADDLTMAEAFERIVQACLHAVLVNAALIQGDTQGDATHKARIALRRLRAALDLFAPRLRRRPLKTLRAEIRWIANRLGDARDADVFQSDVFETAAADKSVHGAMALAAVMRTVQRRTHARLRKALTSKRWRLLLLDLLNFSSEGLRRRHRQAPFRPFVRKRLGANMRALARRGRGLRTLAPTARHHVRKQAKMLRYDLDAFEGVRKLGGRSKAFRLLQGNLHTIQQTLGALQDQDAMRDHLRRTLKRRNPPAGLAANVWHQASAAADVLASRRVVTAAPLGDAHKALKRLRSSHPFKA